MLCRCVGRKFFFPGVMNNIPVLCPGESNRYKHLGPMDDRVQLTPFEIGQIKAHLYHGLGPVGISRIVKKPDGSPISHGRISLVASKLASDPQCTYM